MSLGNTSIHQRGEIPEITKLPNGRIRVVRRFEKFTREDVDNANLGSLLGDFGDLDTAGEQITNQGYTNCRLISVEVDTRVNSTTNTENPLLVQTYETLTNQFVEITDPIVEIQENGLAKITKTYRAISGTTPPRKIGVNAAYAVTNPTNQVTVTASEGSGTYQPNANFTKWIRQGDDPEQYVFQNTSGEAVSSEWIFYDVLDGNPLYSSDTNGYLPWEVEWPAASGISFSTQSNSTVYGLLANSELEDTTAFAQLTEVYLEAGIISETTRPAPPAFAGAVEITRVSTGVASVPAGVLIDSVDENVGGYSTFTRVTLKSLGDDANDLTGVTSQYKDLVEVSTAGVVTLTAVNVLEGSVAIPKHTPPRVKQVSCNVITEIVTTLPDTAPSDIAFNLEDLSCSVTTTKSSLTKSSGNTVSSTTGIFTHSATGFNKSVSNSARIQVYDGSYYTDTGTGGVNYTSFSAPYINDSGGISYETGTASEQTKCIGDGASSLPTSYKTHGLVSRNAKHILTALDGTKYFEVTSFVIPNPTPTP